MNLGKYLQLASDCTLEDSATRGGKGITMIEQLELYIPRLEDLWFYQKIMSDPDTMSYSANWNVNSVT